MNKSFFNNNKLWSTQKFCKQCGVIYKHPGAKLLENDIYIFSMGSFIVTEKSGLKHALYISSRNNEVTRVNSIQSCDSQAASTQFSSVNM